MTLFNKKLILKIKKGIRENNYYILKNNGQFSKRKINESLRILKKKCIYKKNSKKDYKNIYSNPLKIKNYQRLVLEEYGEGKTIRAHNFLQINNPLWDFENLIHRFGLGFSI